MKVPTDREIYQTEIAEFWFDDDGILYCNANAVERSIENLAQSFALVEKITGGRKVCLVTDITTTSVQTKKERDFATSMLPRYYTAIAIVSQSDFGRTIANVFLSLYNLPTPMKLFKDEEEGRQWVKQFL